MYKMSERMKKLKVHGEFKFGKICLSQWSQSSVHLDKSDNRKKIMNNHKNDRRSHTLHNSNICFFNFVCLVLRCKCPIIHQFHWVFVTKLNIFNSASRSWSIRIILITSTQTHTHTNTNNQIHFILSMELWSLIATNVLNILISRTNSLIGKMANPK